MEDLDCSMEQNDDTKNLATAITNFLLDQCNTNPHLTSVGKHHVKVAIACLESVFKIRLNDYLCLRCIPSLREVFERASSPVAVKDRLEAESYKKLGNALVLDGLYRQAEEEYTKALTLDKWNPVYYTNRAASRIKQGSYVGAVADCHHAMSLDRDYAKPYVLLGLAYTMMDRPSRAARCYRKALKIQPENELYHQCMNFADRRQAALSIFEPLLRCGRSLMHIASSYTGTKRSYPSELGGNVVDSILESVD